MARNRSSGWPGALLQILQQICCRQYFTIIGFELGTTKCQDRFLVIQYLVHLVNNVALLKRWWQFKLLVAGRPDTVKKAIGVLNFRRVIPFLVMESTISWVKNVFPSQSAFLFITDDAKIYLLNWWAKIHHICQKRIPSSLMKNVEIVSEYFDVEVKECRKIPQNVAKFHSTSWKCAVSPFSHKLALNNLFYGLEFIQILKEIYY